MSDRAYHFQQFMKSESGYNNSFYEFVDELVVHSLKECILDLISNPDKFDTEDNRSAQLASFFKVLQYYTTYDEYQKFVKDVG